MHVGPGYSHRRMDDLRKLPTVEECRRTAATCACSNLRKAARSITQLYEEALRPLGIRATQFPILMATHGLRAVSVTDLADNLVIDRTTLTRNLAALERQGLVRIAPGEDRRTRLAELTAAGHAVLARASYAPSDSLSNRPLIDPHGGAVEHLVARGCQPRWRQEKSGRCRLI